MSFWSTPGDILIQGNFGPFHTLDIHMFPTYIPHNLSKFGPIRTPSMFSHGTASYANKET